MTLGLFTDDFQPHIGGLGRYVSEVTSRLPEAELLIFSPCDNTISNHIQIRPPFHKEFRNLSFSFWLHRNVNRIVKNYRLSRINIQCGPGGLFLLKRLNLPVVATCHHTWWQQSHYIKSQFWKKMFVPFEKRTYQLASKIICDSEDSKSVLQNRYGISTGKMAVIPIGVDTDKFYPLNNIKKIPCSLLYIGRVDKRKGIDFLISAMPAVTQKVPEAILFVGGTGKDVVKLKEYVKAAGIEKQVKFLGFIAEDKLNRWYNKVQCVVVPSMFEGFGLTAIEAMAAGTSLIATNVDSLKNIVDDGVDGFLVDYGDIYSLTEKIIYLLKDSSKRDELSRKAKEKVATVFNWDRIMKLNMNELYSLS
jgi:glycosyltransferase involved in cell wall biosynthesis